MAQSALDRARKRRSRSGSISILRLALYASPLLVVAAGVVGYRYYVVSGMLEDVRRITAEIRKYNEATDAAAAPSISMC